MSESKTKKSIRTLGLRLLTVIAVAVTLEFLLWRMSDLESWLAQSSLAAKCAQIKTATPKAAALASLKNYGQIGEGMPIRKIRIGGGGDSICVLELDDKDTVKKAYLVEERPCLECQ